MNPVRLLLFLASVALAGCTAPVQQATPFAEGDFLPFKGPGSATILGRASVTEDDGHVITGAGYPVELTPATPYTRERMAISRLGKEPPAPDPRLARYVRTVYTDYTGNFKFIAIPPGEYLVACPISWEVQSPYDFYGRRLKTTWVFGTVSVAEGDRVKITLAP